MATLIIVNSMDNLKKHTKRLADNLPAEGSVRCIQISEKQFGKMILLVGKPKKHEKNSYFRAISPALDVERTPEKNLNISYIRGFRAA